MFAKMLPFEQDVQLQAALFKINEQDPCARWWWFPFYWCPTIGCSLRLGPPQFEQQENFKIHEQFCVTSMLAFSE